MILNANQQESYFLWLLFYIESIVESMKNVWRATMIRYGNAYLHEFESDWNKYEDCRALLLASE